MSESRIGLWGAACFWAAFSFLGSPKCFAAGGKEAIARAQELFLNKNRQAAVKVLLQARTAGGMKATEREELNESLKESATRFLTDKGQRSFELGISELPMQATIALTHFREAQTFEDGNVQIKEALVRGLMAAEDCKSARKEMEQLAPLASALPQLVELELEVAWCLDDVTEVENLIKRKASEQKPSPQLLKLATAWLKWRQNEAERSILLLREVIAVESKNPAALYWLWVIQKEQNLDAQAAATAFSKRCRNHEVEFRRRSSPMIEMCLHLNEVEAYLKTKGAENADEG